MAKGTQSKGQSRARHAGGGNSRHPGRPGRGSGRRTSRTSTRKSTLVLDRRNYALIALGVFLIVTGFVIMRIDNQVEGFVSLYVAPLIIIAGYVGVGYGVISKGGWKKKMNDE